MELHEWRFEGANCEFPDGELEESICWYFPSTRDPSALQRVVQKETTDMDCNFTDTDLLDRLDAMDDTSLDLLSFGLIAMSEDGTVTSYNRAESRLSGLTSSNVVGRDFFSSVAPCTNNFLVAHRFETEPALDAIIEYVFTLRIKPVGVKLRLLKQTARRRMYLAVERR